MVRAAQLAQWLLAAVLLTCALLIASRGLAGPLTSPLRIHSPINVESFFGLAAVLLVLLRAKNDRTRAESHQRVNAAAALVIALFVAALFWRAANFYFLSDDFILLKYARFPAYHAVFTTAGGDGFYRPVSYVSMALTASYAGLSPFHWHMVGFALHATNSILVLLLAGALGFSRLPALFAAALFAAHATRPETVVWVAARADLLAAFFVLLALLAFIRSWDGPARTALLYRSGSVLAMILAFLSKESSYTFPLLLVVFLAWKGVWHSKRAWYALLPFIAVAMGFLTWRWILFGGVGGYLDKAGQPEVFSLGIVPILKTLTLRLWAILFFPINWSTQPGLLLGISLVLYLGALLWLVHVPAQRRQIALPLGFVLALALPPLQQLLIGADLQKARILYLPSVGFCLLLAAAISQFKSRQQSVVALAILAFNVAALQHNLDAWRYASQKAESACAVAAACATGRTGKIAVLGLPGSLGGVYFFANGFADCVEMHRHGDPLAVDLQSPSESVDSCVLSWDDANDELAPVLPRE